MAAKKRPAEFPTDWHWERHLEDLARELLGRQHRLAEFKAMPESPDRDTGIAQTKVELDAVRKQLEHYGAGQEKASKRPAKASSKR